jgi:ribosomal protein S21
MINVEVQRNNNEGATNVLRRFTKRVQGSGILNKVRSLRYSKRAESRYVRKKRTLKGLVNRTERERLLKLGKIVETSRR